MSLETITGNLRDAYKQIVPGTMQHADQLMEKRRDNAELRSQSFYTADGEIYFLNEGIPTLAMTREAHNPVLLNIKDAFKQLILNGDYRPSQEDIQKALVAPETVLIALPNLRLSGDEAECCYLEFGTAPAKYNRLNYDERRLAERVFGEGIDFAKNMRLLKSVRIDEAIIHVLNPKYVQEHAEKGAFARASGLYEFDFNSGFDANGRYFSYHYSVRGVRRKVIAEGDAQQKD